MPDDISTIQVGSPTSLVDATVTIDNTTGVVGATASLLSGGVQVPVTISTATLGANGAVNVQGATAAGAGVGIAFTEGAPTATITTTVAGLATTSTEAAVAVCFCSGTKILTDRGEIAVEDLRAGDLVVTSSGAHRPIRWTGHRTIDCRRAVNAHDVKPISIAANAFGDQRPARDLRVSPGHSLCFDILGEVLIPAMALVNGTTITQLDVDEVTYWHVELDSHDIILADGMPAESYLEMGNRGFFTEADIVDMTANPDVSPATHADFCRPFHVDGALVDIVRQRIAARAPTLGWRLEPTPLTDVHLMVDGVRVEALQRGLDLRFVVPANAKDVWLVSPSARPSDVNEGCRDRRLLGAGVRCVVVDEGFGKPQTTDAVDPRFVVGFHDPEGTHRWTDGRGQLPSELWAHCEGDFFVRIELIAPPLSQWLPPARATADGERAAA